MNEKNSPIFFLYPPLYLTRAFFIIFQIDRSRFEWPSWIEPRVFLPYSFELTDPPSPPASLTLKIATPLPKTTRSQPTVTPRKNRRNCANKSSALMPSPREEQLSLDARSRRDAPLTISRPLSPPFINDSLGLSMI